MTDSNRLFKLLLTVGLLALLVYSGSAALIGKPPIVGDSFSYNASAMRLLNTFTYQFDHDPAVEVEAASAPTAVTMPGYTLGLAELLFFLPHDGATADQAIQNMLDAQIYVIGMQLLFAVGAAVLIAYAGYQVGGLTVARAAGLMAVGYVPFGFNATVALPESTALFLMAVLIAATATLFNARDGLSPATEIGWMVALGIAAGYSVLVRAVIAPWVLIPLIVWVVVNRDRLRRALTVSAVGVACILLVLTPWTVRNAISLGEFIPLTSWSGPALLDPAGAVGLAEGTGGLWADVGSVTNLPIAVLIALQEPGALDEGAYADADAFLPTGINVLYIGLFEIMERYHTVLLALAIAGIAFGRKTALVWVLASIPVYYALVHVVLMPDIRHFYPAMAPVVVLAAFGAVNVYRAASKRRGAVPAKTVTTSTKTSDSNAEYKEQ